MFLGAPWMVATICCRADATRPNQKMNFSPSCSSRIGVRVLVIAP
jgi:hypothetical protein